MAQIIQIKRTATEITAANTLAPATGLENEAGDAASNLAIGELLYASGKVVGTGTGVLYVGNDGSAAASIIGGKAFTDMLDPDDEDALSILKQSDALGGGTSAASLTLADASASGTITLASPASASANGTVLLPNGAGAVAAGSLLSLNSSSKVGAGFGVAGKVTADSGFDATDSGVANAGAITAATHVTRDVDISHELMDGTDDTTDANTRVGFKIQDAAGFFPGGTRTDDNTLWEAGDTFITTSPGVDIDIGYTGQLDAGNIAINATEGTVTGSIISGGQVNSADTQVDNQLNVGLNQEATIDNLGNITTLGHIKSTYQNLSGHLLIDDGSITDALGVTSTGTVQGLTLTDGVASLNAGALTGSTGVTLASGSVTAPVVQTTGTAKLDANEVSGATLALSGNAVVKGSLEVAGSTVIVDASNVTIADSMVQVAADGFGQTVTNDLGWFGNTSRALVAPVSDGGTLVSQNDGPVSPQGTDGIAGTGIIGTDRVIRVILQTDGNTYGFLHSGENGVIGKTHVDGGNNAAPTGTWAVGDAFQVGPTNYPTTTNTDGAGVGKWGATDLYLTYAGMAYDQQTQSFKLLQNDTKPGTNWDTGTSTKATLVANVTGDVTGVLTGNADTASLAAEATALAADMTITLGGDLSGAATTRGTSQTLTATVVDNSVEGKMLHPTAVTGDGTEGSNAGYGLKQNGTDHLEVDWKANGLNDAAVKTLIGTESTSSLSGASDTTISNPVDDNVLSYDDGKWKNQTLAAAGIEPTLANASAGTKGSMSSTHYSKLEAIVTTATANTRGLALEPFYTAAVPDAISAVGENAAVKGLMSVGDKNKLDGIATNAIANITGETFASLSDISEPTTGQDGYKLTGSKSGTDPATYSWVRDDDDSKLDDVTNEIKADHLDFGTDKEGAADQISTTDLPEGNKLYYTDARVTTQVQTNLDTDDLSEAASNPTNLWYTGERVDDRVNSLIQNSSNSGLTWAYVDNAAAAGTLTPTIDLSKFSTANLPEGVGSEYYTDVKADGRITAASANVAEAGKVAKWAANANMDAAGITLGANGIIGDAGVAISTTGADDTVVVTFGGATTAITLDKNGITNTSTSQVMSLNNFTADGGTLSAPQP